MLQAERGQFYLHCIMLISEIQSYEPPGEKFKRSRMQMSYDGYWTSWDLVMFFSDQNDFRNDICEVSQSLTQYEDKGLRKTKKIVCLLGPPPTPAEVKYTWKIYCKCKFPTDSP